MNILDFVLSQTFWWVLIVGFFVVCGVLVLINEKKGLPDSLLSLFFVILFLSFVIIFFLLPLLMSAYQGLRRDLEPPSWETVTSAIDFILGYILLMAVYFLVPFILMGVLTVIVSPIHSRFRRLQTVGTASDVGAILLFFAMIGFYVSTFLGNCSLKVVDNWFQTILFGSAGQTILPLGSLGEWFGNPCNVTTLDKMANVASHPIAASKAFLHFENVLSGLGLDQQLSRLISFILPWLSPIADILGIYLFIESRFSRKKPDS